MTGKESSSTTRTELTFWSFLKSRWSSKSEEDQEIDERSELSVRSGSSEFLYRQHSEYGSYFGITKHS
eukprot:CAMPEP_0197046016 /NCGR_PEP_ID=MMETSP1384-20130603/21783_1 /TAXON_ID=29189 /ORGANISM="Ammonia sp." /LENGTH=67 /DNA_ID=CAMNT_0042477721 /DNA_START=286 /DNA_END=486 /DNA_ORIENTATION=+